MKKVKESVGREGRVFYSGFATKNFEQHFSLFKCSRKKTVWFIRQQSLNLQGTTSQRLDLNIGKNLFFI